MPDPKSGFLPMTRAEMDARGWDAVDIVFVTGDAYIDHYSFAMALLGRVLEAEGFRIEFRNLKIKPLPPASLQ